MGVARRADRQTVPVDSRHGRPPPGRPTSLLTRRRGPAEQVEPTLLDARAADANPSVVHHQEFVEAPRVHIQDVIEPGNLDRLRLVPEAKEDDAAMRETTTEDQLAEVSVIRDEDAVLGDGKGQHIVVGEGSRIFVGDGCSVMAERSEVIAQRQICALVQEKPLHVPS